MNVGELGAVIFSGTPTLGGSYNQLALSFSSGSTGANYRMGVYDDSSAPANFYTGSDTGSVAIPGSAAYTYQNMIAEIILTQNVAWLAWQISSASALIKSTSSANAWKKHNSVSYGSFPSSFGSIDGAVNVIPEGKMRYN